MRCGAVRCGAIDGIDGIDETRHRQDHGSRRLLRLHRPLFPPHGVRPLQSHRTRSTAAAANEGTDAVWLVAPELYTSRCATSALAAMLTYDVVFFKLLLRCAQLWRSLRPGSDFIVRLRHRPRCPLSCATTPVPCDSFSIALRPRFLDRG